MDNQAFIKAVKNIAKEKGISEDVIWNAMQLALITAYKKNFNAQTNVQVDINQETGKIKIVSLKTVVEEVNDNYLEINLEEAKKVNPESKIGDVLEEEVTPQDFGRVAASTAKQVVTQKVREAERESIMSEFNDKQEELVVGLVSREDASNYYIDLGRAHGILPKTETIPGENVVMGSSIKVYITKIENTSKGPRIMLSRTHYGFLKRLLELEVPELQEGIVVLYSIAREAGVRSKIAVYSENVNIDPIGACIGEKGERIQRIIEELNGEKIDVIKYDKDPIIFIKNALSPARDIKVYITNKREQLALVIAEGDNVSLAIGKKGQNIRLAARLTKYKIDLKTSEQAQLAGINFSDYEGCDDFE
ncbi:MAG: transcription termination factor NusA [Bacilli bacterium]|jgi:N utilization substance protein A|nr:transcription termination factor NusA [Bacilli bacterium]